MGNEASAGRVCGTTGTDGVTKDSLLLGIQQRETHIKKLEEQIEQLNNNLTAQESSKANLESQYDEYRKKKDQELAELRKTIWTKDDQIKSLKEEKGKMEKEVERTAESERKAQAELRKQSEMLNLSAGKHAQEITSLKNALDSLTKENARLLELVGDHERRQAILKERDQANTAVQQEAMSIYKRSQLIALEAKRKEQEEIAKKKAEEQAVRAKEKAEYEAKMVNLRKLAEPGDDKVQLSLKDLYNVRMWIEGASELFPSSAARNYSRNPYLTVKVGNQTKKTPVVYDTVEPNWSQYFSFLLEKKPSQIKFHVWDHEDSTQDHAEALGEVVFDLKPLFADPSGYFEGEIKLQHAKTGLLNVRIAARAIPQVTLRWPKGYGQHQEIADSLRYANVNIDSLESNGRTPLMTAAIQNQPDAARVLLLALADIEAVDKAAGLTALQYSSIYGSTEAASVLLEFGAYVDSRDNFSRTPLLFAAQNGFKDMCSLLLDHKADIEAADTDGLTSLIKATVEGHEGVAKTLTAAGAAIDTKAKNGMTALLLASVKNQAGAARILIEARADIEMRDANQFTPLMAASVKGNVAIAQVLVDSKADVDATDSHKRTPLMFAAHVGSVDMAVLLANQGCNLMAKDDENRSAVKIAKDNNNLPVANKLKEIIKKIRVSSSASVDSLAPNSSALVSV